MNHTPLKHVGCEGPYCCICEGGLIQCTICGGAEGSLPKHCPGTKMSAAQESAVYAGRLDFADGQWVGEAAPAQQLPPEPARTAPTDERDPVRVQVGCPTCRGSGFTGYGRGYDDVCPDCAGNPTWTETAMARVWRDGDRYFVWIYDGDGGVVNLESPPAESATPNLDALGDLPW